MDVDRTDLAIFVYNAGVVLSGGFVAFTFDITSYAELVPFSLVVGLLWTGYYRTVMERNLTLPGTEDEEDAEGELPPEADDSDDEEPPAQNGPDAPWE